MTTFHDLTDTPTDRLPRARDRRVPIPAWLADPAGWRLALAVNSFILLIALVGAPIAAVTCP